MSRTTYPCMFAPLRAGERRFRCRVLCTALPERPGESAAELADRYETLARGGFAGVVLPQGLEGPARERVVRALRDHGAEPLEPGDPRLVWADGLEAAAEAKRAGAEPVAALCDFTAPGQVERALASGACDLVVLTRQQLADPEFVNKALLDREREIAPCLGCEGCAGGCAVNPRCGEELRWRTAPRPTGKRRVLVLGAGVSGLTAAATAAGRGHDVILAETCRQPGGLLWYADVDPRREALRRFRDCLVARCRREGVKFHLGVTADGAYLDKMQPDAVICAVGGRPVRPEAPGGELTRYALSAYEKPEQAGQRVVVLSRRGAGREVAGWLAANGREVTVLELERTQVLRIAPEGVTVADGDGTERLLPADTVLYDLGQRPDAAALADLREHSGLFFPVGVCAGAESLGACVRQGFCAAMDVL